MTDTPPQPRGRLDTDATIAQLDEVFMLQEHLLDTNSTFFRRTPKAKHTRLEWAHYMTDRLHAVLPDFGYHALRSPSATVQPIVEWAIESPQGLTPCLDRTHAEEVLSRSTKGAVLRWRIVGPWRDDPAPT